MGCITDKQLRDIVEEIDTKAEVKEYSMKLGRTEKFDIWSVSNDDIDNLLRTRNLNKSLKSTLTTAAKRKLTSFLNLDRESRFQVGPLVDLLTVDNNKVKSRTIALTEVMASLKAEVDKAGKYDVDTSELIDSRGLIPTPLARIAGVIGRKYMIAQGFKFTNKGYEKFLVEKTYAAVGRNILKDLANEGAVTINTDGRVVNDFYDSEKGRLGVYSDQIRKAETVVINFSALYKGFNGLNAEDTKKLDAQIANSYIKKAKNPAVITPISAVLSAASTPITLVTETLPSEYVMTDRELEEGDSTKNSDMFNNVRKEMHERGVMLQPGMHTFISQLAEEFNAQKLALPEFLRSTFNMSEQNFIDIFGIKQLNSSNIDKEESIRGQNLSVVSPLENLLIHFDNIGNNQKVHLMANYARNNRLHYMNSILNPHTSKFDRALMTTGEYTIDMKNDTEAYSDFISEVADETGYSTDEIQGLEKNVELDGALRRYAANFGKGSNSDLRSKMAAISHINFHAKSKESTARLDLIGAISDIREGITNNGIIRTSHMTKPDATASGATIMLLQALATENPRVKEALMRLGMLKKDGSVEGSTDLDDIYAILQEAITDVATDDIDSATTHKMADDTTGPAMKALLSSGVFDKGTRELAKIPTVSFLYGQSEGGSLRSMSKDIADKLIDPDSLGKESVIAYINSLLPTTEKPITNKDDALAREGLYDHIVAGLMETTTEGSNTLSVKEGDTTSKVNTTGIVNELYKLLNKHMNKDLMGDLISDKEEIFTDAVEFRKEVGGDMKILPPSATLNGITLEGKTIDERADIISKYGETLEKVYNVIHNVDGTEIMTMENKPVVTVFKTSNTHAHDSNIIYSTINKVFNKRKDSKLGAISAHDSIIADAHFNVEATKLFTKATRDTVSGYDPMMELYNYVNSVTPNTAKGVDLQNEFNAKWKGTIDENIKRKQEALKLFDLSTDAVFGINKEQYTIPDSVINRDEAMAQTTKTKLDNEIVSEDEVRNHRQETKLGSGSPVSTKETKKLKVKNQPKKTAIEILESHKDTSHVIERFLEQMDTSKIKVHDGEFYFDTQSGEVVIGNIDNRGEENKAVDVTTAEGREAQKQLIEHEITHSFITGYLQSNKDTNEVKYVGKTIAAVQKLIKDAQYDGKEINEFTASRMGYIQGMDSITQINEFTSMMYTEPEFRDNVYKMLGAKKSFIQRLIASLEEHFAKWTHSNVSDKDLESDFIDYEKVQASIEEIVFTGQTRKKTFPQEVTLFERQAKGNLGAGYRPKRGRLDDRITGKLTALNETTKSILLDKAQGFTVTSAKQLDQYLNREMPMYSDVRSKILQTYNSTTAFKEIAHYMDVTNFKGKKEKMEVLAMMGNLQHNRENQLDTTLGKYEHLVKDMNRPQKNRLFNFVSKIPLHDYFMYSNDVTTVAGIDQKVNSLATAINNKHLAIAEEIVKLVTTKNVTKDSVYNTHRLNQEAAKDINAYIALRVIQEEGSAEFVSLLQEQPELIKLFKDSALANYVVNKDIHGDSGSFDSVSQTLLTKQFKDPVDIVVFTKDELKRYEYGDNSGWEILRQPEDGKAGIAFKRKIDGFYTEGAATDMSYSSTDITVSSSVLNKSIDLVGSNIIPTGNPKSPIYKLILTEEEENTVGVLRDAGQTLIRSTVHAIGIQDTQVLRDKFVSKALRAVLYSTKGAEVEELKADIVAKNIDHKWFIKLGKGISYSDLPIEIRNEYRPPNKSLSNVLNFDEEITLVRKDLAHWLIGGKENSLFKNPKLQWASRIVKHIVSGAKIGMVIANPKKLAFDAISNVNYLVTMGVPTTKVATYGAKVMSQFTSLDEARNDVVRTELLAKAYPHNKKLVAEYKVAKDTLKNHPLNIAVKYGFINSISSDVINNSSDGITGLQADIDKAFTYLLKNDKEENNEVGKFIMKLSKFGFQGEDFLTHIGKIAGATKTTAEFEKVLKGSAKRIKEIKSEKDVVAYMSQVVLAPNSEIVKGGVLTNDRIDAVSKMVYFMHLRDKGVPSDKAAVTVTDAFPSYLENMPMSVKMLSDYGILMFPSFWLRIQNVAFNMVKRRSLNVGAELGLGNMLDIHVESILDANIYNKLTSFGGVINAPTDFISLDSVFATNINPLR